VNQSPNDLWYARYVVRLGALLFLGFLPASGTVTVILVGVPLYWLMHDWHAASYIVATVTVTAAAVWIHHVGDRILNEKDSRKLVWDELVGFLIAVAFVPFTWQLAVLAVMLERALDIFKIPPAHWIERRVPGGWGIVGDDVIAGLYTLAILHGLLHWRPAWVGITS